MKPPDSVWWLAFFDGANTPLGGCLVEGSSAEDAVQRAHKLAIDAGVRVFACEVFKAEQAAAALALVKERDYVLDRFYSREEIDARGGEHYF